jgi:predicted transcriptional regulator
MTLEEFRKEEGLSLEKLGLLIGVSEETARRYCLPETDSMSRFPNRRTLRTIYTITRGRVTPNDFLNLG